MTCTGCGGQNRNDARFCASCGAPLANTCGSCGRELAVDARFCDGCGTAVAAAEGPRTQPSASVDDAVRKVVTVLFCDVVGSTAFAERVDAEAAREVMAVYHAASREAIEAHGGTVAKFIGDGVMATFGLPEVADDDAERAVVAGLELQRRFAPIRDRVAEQHRVDLALRVGVNTGEVATGASDADLVGDVLNTAARLEAAAPPGEVLVGEATWRLTRSTVGYESGGEVEVKGKAEPLATYLATAAVAPPAETATPFVGRDGELRVLDEALRHAQEAHTAVLVTVIGAPGVGKTRLAAELVDRHRDEVVAFDLRCERAGATTFEPVADLVRAAAGLTVSQSDEELRAGIAALLGPAVGEAGRLVDLIASFVGAAPAPSTEEAFFAVRRLCEHLATDLPLVLVIDDIQWAESRLLDLIEHLGEWVGAPVLIVNLARPEIREVRPPLAEVGRRVRAVVAVGGLDASATRRLAAELLGADALPPELTDRLGASTDGNPLFVRELVRMLVDDEILVRTDDGWDLAVDLEAVEVPPTIQSLLATRVERLPPDERRLVELASVVGSEFALGAVTELAGTGVGDVTALIEGLRRKDVLESTGAYRGDEPVVRFHHVLIRDAAYRRLLKKTRAQLHQQVGEWTERTSVALTGDHEAGVAHHFEQAHRYRVELGLDDDDTAALGRRAAVLLQVAARGSLERDDLPAAGGFALRALALLPADDVGRDDLLVLACEALLGSGDVARAAEPLAELAASTDERTAAWADCFAGQVVTLTDPERLAEAERSVGAAAERLAELGDAAGVAKARQVRALLLLRLARVGEGEAELDRSLVAARGSDDRRRISAVLGAAPQAALWGPSPVAQAGGRCLDVVRLVRITSGSPAVEATSWRCQGVLEALRGRFDTARRLVADSRRACEELGLHQDLMVTELYAGIIALLADDPAGAEPHLRLASEGLGRLGIGADLGQAQAHLARSLLLQGQIDDAEELAAEAAALAGQNPQSVVVARCVQADVLLAKGRPVEAVASAQAAVDRLAGSDVVVDLANAHAALARACAAAGDADGARRGAAEADRLYRLKGATALLDPAVARSDTPADPHLTPSHPVGDDRSAARVRPNAASRVLEAWVAALEAEDVDAAVALGADEIDFREHKRVVTNPVGVDWASAMRSLVSRPAATKVAWTLTPLAVRDERWCLGRIGAEVDGLVASSLNPIGVDETGRISHFGNFEVDDLAGAEALLNEWWLERSAPEHREVFDVLDEMRRAQDSQDLERLVELTTSDVQVVDHRPLIGVGTLDRAGMVAVVPGRNAPGQQTVITDVSRLSRDGAVFAGVTLQEVEGVTAEFPSWWAIELVDGQARRVELFDIAEEQAALARFEQMATRTVGTVRRNLAVGSVDAFIAAMNAGDVEAAVALGADGAVVADRRRIVAGSPADDWETVMRSLAPYPGTQTDRWESTPLAVRDDRWSLTKARVDLDGMVIEWLSVSEVDEAGRFTRSGTFDADDLANAEELLNEWWLAALDPARRDVIHVGVAFRVANDAMDQDAIAAVLADDLVYVDHRRVIGSGEQEFRDLVGEVWPTYANRSSLCTDIERLTEAGVVATLIQTELGGVATEYRSRGLMLMTNGLLQHLELFDADDDTALTRFDELTASAADGVRRNAAVRAVEVLTATMSAGDVEAAVALGADGAVVDDRRRIVAGSRAETWATVMRSLAPEPGTEPSRWESTPLAVRDDRWCLTKARADLDGLVVEWLRVTEVDDAGRFTRTGTFDLDDLEPAEALLDEWWLAEREPAEREVFGLIMDLTRANDRHDVATVTALLSEDFEFVDHRRLIGWEAVDRQALLDSLSLSMTEHTLAQDVVRLTHRGLAVRSVAHYALDGVEAEAEHAWTIVVQEGRIHHLEVFDGVNIDLAAARFDELTPSLGPEWSTPDTAPPVRENLSLRSMARVQEIRHDRSALLACARPDAIVSDRRALIGTGEIPWSAFVDSLVFSGWRVVPLAVRGERLGLVRWSGEVDGLTANLLGVGEVDVAGLVARVAFLDTDDDEVAYELLDEWWLEGEGAEHREVIGPIRVLVCAYGAGDAAAATSVLTPDSTVIDHRSGTSLPAATGRDWLRALVDATRTIGHSKFRVTDVPVVARHGVLLGVATHRADGESTYVRHSIRILLVRDGLISHFEVFDAADEVRALARFEELTAGTPVVAIPENAATRIVRAFASAVVAADLDHLVPLLAPEVSSFDGRQLAGLERRGLDAVLEGARSVLGNGLSAMDTEIIAVRGDRLCLARCTARFEQDYALEFLYLQETREDGLAIRIDFFDPDDLRRALDRLGERFAELTA